MFLEDVTGEFTWSKWQAETFLPVTLPTEAEEKPEKIFTALPLPQHHCGWLWSLGWVSVKLVAFCTAALCGPQEAFLAVTAPCSNYQGLFSLCAQASPLVWWGSLRVYAGTGRPTPACLERGNGLSPGREQPMQYKRGRASPRIQQSSCSFLHLIPSQSQTILFPYLCAAKTFWICDLT